MHLLRLLPCLALALLLGACSLALDLDEEGLACDAQGHCLEGYRCVEGACERDEALPCACDAGVDCEAPDAGRACP